MSLNAMLWAIHLPRSTVSGGPRDALALLADRANPDGTAAWPTAGEIALILGVGERQARRYLAQLEEDGLIRRGDQRLVEHIRADRRPVVWDLVFIREQPVEPVDNSAPRGDTSVTPSPSRGDIEGPRGVTSDVRHGVTSDVHRTVLSTVQNHPGAQARGGAASVDKHKFELNARRALATLRTERRLPLDVDELLEMAYEVGGGDPWAGYLEVKVATTADLETVRDVRAVVRKRLGLEPSDRPQGRRQGRRGRGRR